MDSLGLHQDLDHISPVLNIEVRAQAIPHAGGSRAYGKRSRELIHRQRKAHSVHLGMVYCLADWKPNPLDFRLVTMLVGWLIILPRGSGWDIMGCESKTLPSYPKLRNFYYSVKLIKCTYSLFIPPACSPRLDPTRASSVSSLEFSPPPCTETIQSGRPPSPLWLSAPSLCIL